MLDKINDRILHGVRKVSLVAMLFGFGATVYNGCSATSTRDSETYQRAIKLQKKMGEYEKKLAQCVPDSDANREVSYECIGLKGEYNPVVREFKEVEPAYRQSEQEIADATGGMETGLNFLFIGFPFLYVSTRELKRRRLMELLQGRMGKDLEEEEKEEDKEE
jgi:hypothetical protein